MTLKSVFFRLRLFWLNCPVGESSVLFKKSYLVSYLVSYLRRQILHYMQFLMLLYFRSYKRHVVPFLFDYRLNFREKFYPTIKNLPIAGFLNVVSPCAISKTRVPGFKNPTPPLGLNQASCLVIHIQIF